MIANLLAASVLLSTPRPESFPPPQKYYRLAKAELAPDIRCKNSMTTVDAAVERLAMQPVFPVIPWLYVQLREIGEWSIREAYLASIIGVNQTSWDRWTVAKDRRGVNGLWQDAASALACTRAASRAVSSYFEAIRRPTDVLPLPEPDDAWTLKEKTWFSDSVKARIACDLANMVGLRPADFPADASPEDVIDRLNEVVRKSVFVVHTGPRPTRLGRVWSPATSRK